MTDYTYERLGIVQNCDNMGALGAEYGLVDVVRLALEAKAVVCARTLLINAM